MKKTAFVRKHHNSRGGYITELFSAANPFALMRSLARVYSDMHSQCAPLDEGLGAVGTFEGAFICVNALVPREVRSTAKRLFRISNARENKRIGIHTFVQPSQLQGKGRVSC